VLTFPVFDELGDPPLLVRDAEAVIEGHLRSSPDGVGAGILIRAGTADGGSIGAAVPAKRAETYGLEPVLPVDVWPAAYQAAHDRGGEIAGWYHWHALAARRDGPALSAYDRDLHRILFSDPSSVALVIDPATGRRRWFGWTVPRAGTGETGAVAWTAPLVMPRRIHDSRTGRTGAVALVMAGVIAAGGAGYALATATHRAQGDQPVLRTRLQEAARDERALRAALAQSEANLAAARAEEAALRERLADAECGNRPRRPPAAVTYRVQPGDTLSRLAAAFYGSAAEWRRIFQANRPAISDPNLLPAGMLLRIPAR